MMPCGPRRIFLDQGFPFVTTISDSHVYTVVEFTLINNPHHANG